MSNKEQLQNNNVQLANLIQTLQSKAVGGGTVNADWNAAEGEAGHVLNRTHYVTFDEKTVYSEIACTPADGKLMIAEQYGYYPADGETCIVTWNGVDYTCTAFVESSSSFNQIAIGNKRDIDGGSDTGEPFSFILFDEVMAALYGAYCIGFANDGSTAVTISVKAKNETVHRLDDRFIHARDWNAANGETGHILNRTHYTERDVPVKEITTMGNLVLGSSMPVIGKIYKVTWNGVTYECIAEKVSYGVTLKRTMDGVECPFILDFVENATMVGVSVVIKDGSDTYTVSVEGDDTIHQLDEKYIPDMSKLTLLSPNGTRYQITVDDSGNLTATAAT